MQIERNFSTRSAKTLQIASYSAGWSHPNGLTVSCTKCLKKILTENLEIYKHGEV